MTESNRILDNAEVDFLLDAGGADAATGADGGTAGPEQAVTMRGNLDQINLSDIFQTLSMTKMEGVLEIQSPLEKRQVYCKDGYVQVLVPPRLIHRRIGQRLVSAGLITAEQLRSALMRQRKERRPIGALLIEDGVLTEQQIEDIASTQVAEDLFALFTWRHGTFAFYKGEIADPGLREKFAACPEFEVSSLLLEVARRSDEWESILKVVGNLDEIPVRRSDDEPATQLSEIAYTLFRSADGLSSYRTLAEQSTQGLFEVARAARDLVREQLLVNIDHAQMVAVADGLVQGGKPRDAVVVLQTLRDRGNDLPLDIVRAMANVLRAAGEPRLAGATLLDVARQQTDPELALQLARDANALAARDGQTLAFLRQLLVQLEQTGEELDRVTLELLDSLLDSGLNDQATALVAESRASGTASAQQLQREAKARQKLGDAPGAIAVLVEIAELCRADENRSGQIEAYEAILRLDRTHKDAQRVLHKLRQTRIGRIVRIGTAAAVVLLMAASAVVWWSQKAFEANVTTANLEVGELLRTGDRLAARERLEHWCSVLGEGDPADDLRRQVDFADAADLARQTKLARKRMQDRLLAAAQALEDGALDAAFTSYSELMQAPELRAEVAEVVCTRVDALIASIDRTIKNLAERMPPEPTLRQSRADLQQNHDLLRSLSAPTVVRVFDALEAMQRSGTMPTCVDESRRQALVDVVVRARPTFDLARKRLASYTTAIANVTEQRQFDPTFKEAMRREEAHDFAGALDLYRLLEKLEGIDAELRAMFRDRVARNATIVRLLEAESKAAASGDFDTARQHLRALRTAFPDVPFDQMVRLPLRIESLPPGAKVLCGEREVAVTPCVIAYVPAENTLLSLQAPGFEPANLEVTGDQVGTVRQPMRRCPDRTLALDGAVDAVPATALDQMWLVDRSGSVRAITDGQTQARWTHRTGDLSGYLTPPVLVGELLLFGSLDGELRALRSADGDTAWSLKDLPTESPIVAISDHVLLASTDDRLVDVALADRAIRTMPLPGAAGARIVHAASRALVLTARSVACVTMPGFTVAWTRALSGANEGHGAQVDTEFLVLDDRGVLQAFDLATGEPKWRTRVDAGHLGALCAVDGDVLVTLPDRLLRFRARDGAGPTLTVAADRPWSAPALRVGNHLVVPTADGPVDVRSLRSGELEYQLPGSRGARVVPWRDGVLVSNPDRTLSCFRSLP